MKKYILIFCAVLISLTGFSIKNSSNSIIIEKESVKKNKVPNILVVAPNVYNRFFNEFIYDVGPRFNSIKLDDIKKARTIHDFISDEKSREIHKIKSVSIINIIDEKQSEIREIGYNEELTETQLKLLKTYEYSTNFVIKIEFIQKNEVSGTLHHNYTSPHLTVTPDIQAEYIHGKKSLINYLKENSKEARVKANVDPDKLQPAKLYFTVTKNGTIENARLDRTSKYPIVDDAMIELIKTTNNAWKPAKNTYGEPVNQELVVSFGLMGC